MPPILSSGPITKLVLSFDPKPEYINRPFCTLPIKDQIRSFRVQY